MPWPADSAAPGIQADPQLWVRAGDEPPWNCWKGPRLSGDICRAGERHVEDASPCRTEQSSFGSEGGTWKCLHPPERPPHSLRWAKTQATCSQTWKANESPRPRIAQGQSGREGAGQTDGQCVQVRPRWGQGGGRGTPEIRIPWSFLTLGATPPWGRCPCWPPHEDVLRINEAPRPRNTSLGSGHGALNTHEFPLRLCGPNQRVCPHRRPLTLQLGK